MQLKLLADHPEFLPTIARWYFEEWGRLVEIETIHSEIEKLKHYLNVDKVPLMIIAIEDGECLGVAQLKFHEMEIYQHMTHWLGGVYVAEQHRGKGIARHIITELIKVAKSIDVPTLYLQTENLEGGLYGAMGWLPIEQVHYKGVEVMVMEKKL